MDRKFLLTYEIEDENGDVLYEYAWFETAKHLKEFVEDHNVMVNTAIEINDYKPCM
jgi:hypothetical protein